MKLWLNVSEGAEYAGVCRDSCTRPASVARSDTRASVDEGPFG
jgi:hypothetical protein